MSDDLVTVATYRFASKAEAARSILEQEAIRDFVADAELLTANPFFGPAVGNIKLQVPRSQAEAALEVLNRHPGLLDVARPEREDEADAICLECGEPLPEDSNHCPNCGWSYGDDAIQEKP
jgi:hypothetical protein